MQETNEIFTEDTREKMINSCKGSASANKIALVIFRAGSKSHDTTFQGSVWRRGVKRNI